MFRRLSRTMGFAGDKDKEEKKYKYKAFLSHNWGEGKKNHERVQRVHTLLKEKGIDTWLDQEQLEDHLAGEISKGIEESEYVIIFLTEEYMNKVNQSENPNDFCKLEFKYAANKKPHNLVLVAMEPRMKNSNNWEGELGFRLADRKYIDLSQESRLEAAVDQIVNRLFSPGTNNTTGRESPSQAQDQYQSHVATNESTTTFPPANPIKTPREALEVLQNCSFQSRTRVIEAIQLLYYKTEEGDWVRRTVAELPGIETIISQTLFHFESDEDMCQGLLALISGLCLDAAMRVKFMQVGIIQQILATMSNFITNSEIAKFACTIFGHLSFENNAVRVIVMQNGADDAILSSMERHVGVAFVAHSSCYALRNLALNDDNKVILIRKGADDAIFGAMKLHIDDVHVTQVACGALANLASNKKYRKRLRDKGALKLTKEIKLKFPGTEAARQANRLQQFLS